MKKRLVEFRWGSNTTEDKRRSGHPKTSTTDKLGDVIHCIILDDERLTVQQKAKSSGISSSSVYIVLTEIFGVSKQSAK